MKKFKTLDVIVTKVINHRPLDFKTFVFGKEDGSALPGFKAGQYISVRLKIGESFVTRPYSLSSSPKDAMKGRYEITVQNNPDGLVASWMFKNFKKGSKLSISYPQGDANYKRIRDGKTVMALAGGGGVTPFFSMAKAVMEGSEKYNLTILYGSPDRNSILFKKEFDEICKATDKVKVVHTFDNEKQFINADLVKKYYKKGTTVFVCGPGPMYTFLEKDLKKLNIPKRHLRMGMPAVSRDVPEKGKVFSVTVQMGKYEYTVDANSDEPVLVALERAGIKAKSCCRSGKCGFCNSTLINGSCYVSEEYRQKGRKIHLCASFPASDLVIKVEE